MGRKARPAFNARMGVLDTAARIAQGWYADGFERRQQLVAAFESFVTRLNDAVQVWQSYEDLDRTQPVPEVARLQGGWLGERRRTALASIDRDLNRLLDEIAALVDIARAPGDDEVMLVIAQREIKQGAPADAAARAAIRALQSRMTQVRDLLAMLRLD